MRTNDFAVPRRPLKSVSVIVVVLGMVSLLGGVPSLAQAFSLTTTTTTSLASHRTPFRADKTSTVPLFARKKPTRGLATSSSTASSSSSFYPFSSSSSPGNSTTLLSSAAASSHHHHQHIHSHQHHETATPGPAGNVFVHDEPGPPPPPPALAQLALNQKKKKSAAVSTWIEERILSTYWGPRLILAALAAIYASNFNLGAVMNDHLPASSAATCARMVLAAAALAPAIPHLATDLRLPAVLCGCFTSLGYVTQSVALQDVDPARVSFLGSLTVLWCPLLEWVVDGKPMGWKDAPQTWLAAVMCLAGVAALELQGVVGMGMGSSGVLSELSMSTGDGLALLQAVGFGTGVFWTARMLNNRPDQALPVTATLLATTAFNAMLWSLADGWMFTTTTDDWMHTAALPGLLFNTDLRHVAAAVVWTGLISTSLNFYIELTVLGRVPPSEASVILASEPLWAALFAAAFMPDSSLTAADGVGGALIVGACLVNALVRPTTFGWPDPADKEEYDDDDGDDYLDDDSNDKNHVVMALPTTTTTTTTTTTSQTTAMAAAAAGDDELQAQRQPLQMAASMSTRDTSTSSARSRQPQVY